MSAWIEMIADEEADQDLRELQWDRHFANPFRGYFVVIDSYGISIVKRVSHRSHRFCLWGQIPASGRGRAGKACGRTRPGRAGTETYNDCASYRLGAGFFQ